MLDKAHDNAYNNLDQFDLMQKHVFHDTLPCYSQIEQQWSNSANRRTSPAPYQPQKNSGRRTALRGKASHVGVKLGGSVRPPLHISTPARFINPDKLYSTWTGYTRMLYEVPSLHFVTAAR
jgi:hypothetical protein